MIKCIKKMIEKIADKIIMYCFPQICEDYKKEMDEYTRTLAEAGFYDSEAYRILCQIYN